MNGVPLSRAQIHRRRLGLAKVLESENMGVGEVIYVNVIADAGAVGGRVIGAKDF